MAVKEVPIKFLLPKWYMLPNFSLCLDVRVCLIRPFASDYISIDIWTVELSKIELLLLMMFTGIIIINLYTEFYYILLVSVLLLFLSYYMFPLCN
jgi:hypothetical protein